MVQVKSPRIASIDLLRGMVMIFMALDHTRDYFHYDAFFFDPTDLSKTNIALFITRFITHYCAPVFMFLAGTSAFFVGQKRSKKDLSIWLLKRGFWLIIVEVTIMKFGWNFNLNYTVTVFQVIWALGASMLFLAAFIHVPKKLMIAISLIVIFGHNMLDGYMPEYWKDLWILLHVQAPIKTSFTTIFVAYPLIPWIFVMTLGYHFGLLYKQDFKPEIRIKWLRYIGVSAILLFIIIRYFNVYGNPTNWELQKSFGFTVLSFINFAKYPPSLLYLLVTLGPTILLLSFAENWKGKLYNAVVTIGRVPMFFYIIHVYIIHLLALVAVTLSGLSPKLMVIELFVTRTPELKGYGYSLWVVYAIWFLLILALYPVCKWYWNYKNNNRDKWWLSYL
ncbi:DUF1624 domain-containing protein [Yeosuana marina]|uniref:DUF1624 domain-containing protein n=1 Tax=Yeosuana marina TaxID=1565536 RepID=UPI0030C8C2D5